VSDVPTTRAAAILTLAVAAALLGGGSAPAASAAPEFRVLVFTKTAGFRHDSIPTAVEAVSELGGRHGFQVDATENAAVFSESRLQRYDVVVFLLTTGDVLDDRQQAAFQSYIRSGGGIAGVHSASDTEHGWPWYAALVGAYFLRHPPIQRATVDVVAPRDASTRDLPPRWTRTDEWYTFATNPRGSVRVLATLDETTYAPGDGAMGDHPIAWSHLYDGGRAWYTAGGHTQESYAEPLFLDHLLGGILWAAGPPRILSLAGVVRDGRLVLRGRTATCLRCRAVLRVRVGGGSRVESLRVDAGRLGGRSAVLPTGRWPYTVVLRDAASGLTTTVTRSVRVR
jgi:cytochrome c